VTVARSHRDAVGDDAADRPEVAEAGAAGYGYLVAALGYSNRYATDGFIPASVASRLLGGSDALTAAMKGGLLEPVEREAVAGFQIAERYVREQPTAAEIERCREQNRLRQQKRRGRGNDGPEAGDVTRPVTRDIPRDSRRDSRGCHAPPDPDPDPQCTENTPLTPRASRRGKARRREREISRACPECGAPQLGRRAYGIPQFDRCVQCGGEDLFSLILPELDARVRRPELVEHFHGVEVATDDGNAVIVTAPTQLAADLLALHYREPIVAALTAVGVEGAVEFRERAA
jgi:hypothetical protein